jgi:hypothetical protein
VPRVSSLIREGKQTARNRSCKGLPVNLLVTEQRIEQRTKSRQNHRRKVEVGYKIIHCKARDTLYEMQLHSALLIHDVESVNLNGPLPYITYLYSQQVATLDITRTTHYQLRTFGGILDRHVVSNYTQSDTAYSS